ncbi:putative aldehyde oxygenase (deformylating) [Rosa chinensis]|uniref:Putative aldehyde oxygenase (Deformylating) n=1 Tax=Rosa chinensis TaxID=74649 RepID=A0A2P6SCB2_ROSCH|nr:putative aldehyde oxygenase (deformylating) [Rosa chinensis]
MYISAVTQPFAEHVTYFMLFAIPMLATLLIGTASISSYFAYNTYIEFMNNLGHCNFDLVIFYTNILHSGKRESPDDVVHLTHLTTTKSIYRLPLAFASLASNPHTSTWYLWLLWPYLLSWQNEAINKAIEDGILEAEQMGVKVISLGLFNRATIVCVCRFRPLLFLSSIHLSISHFIPYLIKLTYVSKLLDLLCVVCT